MIMNPGVPHRFFNNLKEFFFQISERPKSAILITVLSRFFVVRRIFSSFRSL